MGQGSPPACCAQKTITVPPDINAKTAQKHEYGSALWRRSYARRTAAERANSTINDPASNDISRGWCRLMGLAPLSFLVTCCWWCATCASPTPSRPARPNKCADRPRAIAKATPAAAEAAHRPRRPHPTITPRSRGSPTRGPLARDGRPGPRSSARHSRRDREFNALSWRRSQQSCTVTASDLPKCQHGRC